MFSPLLLAFLSFPSLVLSKPTISTAWFAGWHGADSSPAFTVDQIPWDKYTELTYAFAETTPNSGKLDLSGSEPEILPQFVAAAHANGVKAKVSIGGWTGSRFFSTAVATAANRTLFVKAIVDLATTYNLDGIDIDWEYPNLQGIGCNTINSADSSRLLSLLKQLRADPVGTKLILSAAVVTPFRDASGNPMSDVSAFADVLDYVAIMNYDVNGPWSPNVAANAPLMDSCAPAEFQAGSATDFVDAWIAAGFPANKIVLGVPGYGHSFAVATKDAFADAARTKLAMYAAFNAGRAPTGDAWDDAAETDECGNAQSQGGVINFWGLIAQGYLNANGTAKAGVPFMFDTCSQTPFVYNTTTQVMISYDDARSFALKGQFIKSRGLAGFAMWEAGGDSGDILINSIRSAAGF